MALMIREIRTCLVCGASFSAADENEFCPVCLLRNALADGIKSEESADEGLQPAPARENPRLEHYELVTDKDGRPVELGRGAMGVTYKAMDVDLRCPVALKVISEKYLGEEAARTRFIREARAAASVRHPNVASVFHLGRKGRDYFYAMEFVEGETLDSLIKRSGRLDVKLALEITRQVASGLAAVHKKSLVHRDIKPSNIMVSFEEEALTAKIIDLGLAKATDEFGAQTTISASGAFAGNLSMPVQNKLSAARWISVRISTHWVFRSGKCLLVRCRFGVLPRELWLSTSTRIYHLRSSKVFRSRWPASSKCFSVKVRIIVFRPQANCSRHCGQLATLLKKAARSPSRAWGKCPSEISPPSAAIHKQS